MDPHSNFWLCFFPKSDLASPERTGGVFIWGREALFPAKLSTKFSGCSTNENPSIWAPQILYHRCRLPSSPYGCKWFHFQERSSPKSQVRAPRLFGAEVFNRFHLRNCFYSWVNPKAYCPRSQNRVPGQPNLRHRQPNMRPPAELEVFLEVDSSPFYQSPKTDIEIEKSTVNQRKKAGVPHFCRSLWGSTNTRHLHPISGRLAVQGALAVEATARELPGPQKAPALSGLVSNRQGPNILLKFEDSSWQLTVPKNGFPKTLKQG